MDQLILLIKNLPQVNHYWVDGDVLWMRLGSNDLHATFVQIRSNGKNYDMKFIQRIQRVWCPSTKTHKEPRDIVSAELKGVPFNQIPEQYMRTIGWNYNPEMQSRRG